MTRKDYELIAAALRAAKPAIRGTPAKYGERLGAWAASVESLAAALKGDNPRFDPDRFVDACVKRT